jgi:signal peptidase I
MNDFANSTAYLVFGVAAYVILALPLYVMGTKTNAKNPWFAFVPILNAFLFVEIAGKEWWWVLLLCVPCINIIVAIYLWMVVAEAMNKPSWVGILMIVPGLGLLVPYYLAFG